RLYVGRGTLRRDPEARTQGPGRWADPERGREPASLATTFFLMAAAGMLNPDRGANATDSGSHFYDVYECADGQWISVGPIEPKFYAVLLGLLEIDPAELGPQMDPANWSRAKSILPAKFPAR